VQLAHKRPEQQALINAVKVLRDTMGVDDGFRTTHTTLKRESTVTAAVVTAWVPDATTVVSLKHDEHQH